MPTNWDNLKEMGKFTETYKLPKLKGGEIENLNRLTARKEIELVTKELSTTTTTTKIFCTNIRTSRLRGEKNSSFTGYLN